MKILLLTDAPPCKEFSGGLLTDSLCRYIHSEEIVCVVVRDKHLAHIKTSNDLDIKTLYLTKPRENAVSFLSGKFKIYKIFNFIYELYSEFILNKKLARQIVKFGRQHDVDRLWCILQGQTTIRLAIKVHDALNVPLLTQVWDHVSWWIGHNNIDKLTSRRIINQYERTLSLSACCGAASFVMAEHIRRIGIPAIPLVSSLSKDVACKCSSFPDKIRDTINIGFSGQTYADAAFNTLIESLDSIEWKFENKEIKLRILGYNLSLSGHVKRNIEYLGYRSQIETIDLLSACDLLFCPYITDLKYSFVAQTSFPAKLSTYLATGVPVLYVGTANSSPALFLEENNAGFICTELNTEKLVALLQKIFLNKEAYEQIAQNGLKAFQRYLTYEKQKELFMEFLHYGD